ncbi:hypothetical protein HY487_00995 [Candidatus Woesearchaeota archaeon]|nr:hypothetical protein [Candidatus Woesearchaeota archaeon]
MSDEFPFVPFQEFGAPVIDTEKAEMLARVDLRELPLETVIEFHGRHPVSIYTAKLTTDEEGRRLIKIWLNRRASCAIGPIDSVISCEAPGIGVERGVMQVGQLYLMPTFRYLERELRLDFGDTRVEPYTKIYVQRPPSKA